MADESISIEVKDSVDKNAARSLSEISSQARGAWQNVEKLIKQLNRVKPAGLEQVSNIVSKAQREMQKAALSAEKLATQQQRTVQAAANAATAEQRLATATANADRAQTSAQGAADRLAASQARQAAAADKATAAQQRASAAAAQQASNLKANDTEIARITGVHDRFNAVMERNPKYAKAFAEGTKDVAKQAGLARHELINLSYQLNDVGVGLVSGQKPLTILAQQGAQIGQIFGASKAGMGAIFRQLGGILARFIPYVAAAALVVGTLAAPFELFTRAFNKGLDEKKILGPLKLTKDQMETLKDSGEKVGITLGDTFKATFQVIGKYLSTYFGPVIRQFSSWWGDALDWMTNAFSVFIRFSLANWLSFADIVKIVFKNIPAAIELAVKESVNAVIASIEYGINAISKGLTGTALGKMLGIEGKAPELKLPRLQLSADAKNMEKDITTAWSNAYKKADKIVTKFGKDVKKQALANARNRIKEAAGDADDPKKAKTGGFNKERELKAINDELDSQTKHMFALANVREALNKVDEIAIRFQKAKHPLTQQEIDDLRNKIQAINDMKETQKEFDRIYNEVSGPQRTYNATLAAAKMLLDQGVISQARYNAEVTKAAKAQRDAQDPAAQMLDDVREQVRLLGFLGPLREKEQQLEQARNAYRSAGIEINQKTIDQLNQEITALQQKKLIQDQIDAAQQNSLAQKAKDRSIKTDAVTSQVGKNGFTGQDAVMQLGQDNPGLQATAEFAQAQIASYTDMYAQIDALRQADIISETSAVQAKMALFQEQYQTQIQGAMTALGALASLQNSENKKQAAIGKKAAIAQTIIQTYQSATSAFSSLAGIPYVGPILGAAAAAAAIAAGMANVQRIRSQNAGFKEGGFTGNIPTNAIAGPVHGQEYVFDAPATSRIGVGNLEALRRGRIPVEALGRGESDASITTAPTPARVGSDQINYNQTVNVTVAGKRDRRTAEQEARSIRRESTRELIRSGG